MIYPQVFEQVRDNLNVQTFLGTNPVRFFPFGYAPQDTTQTYAVWQTISGTPQNTLHCPPDADDWTVQVDIYATDVQQARGAGTALIEALQVNNWITSIRGESRDFETKKYRYSFDVQLLQSR